MSPNIPSIPVSIAPTASELENGELGQRNLEIAIRALFRDGLVVLENMVDHAVLDRLNKKMVEDAYELQAREDSPFNYNKGNIQQDPPMTKEWFSKDIYVNPIVTHVTSTMLGPKPSLRFVSGNTALPPTASSPPASQPTHNDADFDHPSIPFALVVNVPLVTMTPENGSTEVWLGTHDGTTLADQEGEHGDRASGRIKKHLLDARREVRPPTQPVVKKGSIIIRDLRLWHGGKPNLTQTPRVMLAMIHFAPWYRNQMQVEFAEELEEELSLEKTGLRVAGTYVPSEQLLKNYLNRPYGNAYDFNQTEKIEGVF
ncbi:phytanoyl-CoA dioxygenase family protein [Pyrenophora tritici-repentis]|uniref:Phytanoyl-CoA dioxygenase family protein n=2 Tax=Pyrenophora tritici-repentis TaxID=45151 RepID=A0A2W1F4Z3_9PLEO|nr:phytanoyl-CoA dioxygenase family protein [Pyrenophora tritici-repentis Pt-1C-BFP]KAA8627571.1 Phytanoyl-CoA dioxygenase family protein [Pyrenophora tritici-repentis]EDU42045.1 phytanoyl-CoA dioxygenase family protein [Pyrenophora tritici-repentis Pt-1C-BFP]KAF7442397.1 Phytanoyl-CoA dioxygenase family protein [Pyrenophora tritici-repentis]KAF7579231.1 phytanoyl-CoA dioxygenase family protein [Pyrenophora tritici-repentis]KAG9378160.1 Phytanoyl-CoA dioxygenase family protein [Pyrenophora tri